MKDRSSIYKQILYSMKDAGFVVEKEQQPFRQNKRQENEYKLIHPDLEEKMKNDGTKMRGKKFYLKPLSDEPDCEIGLVNGSQSTLHRLPQFTKPNGNDTHDNAPAWINKEHDKALDGLIASIKSYLNN